MAYPYNIDGTAPSDPSKGPYGEPFSYHNNNLNYFPKEYPPQGYNSYLTDGQLPPKCSPVGGAFQQQYNVPPEQGTQRVTALVIPPSPASSTTTDAYRNARHAPALVPAEPSLDYSLLLLSLAEEYLKAAHDYRSMASIARRDAEMQMYYKLLATGLGCLEAVLKHFKLAPEQEALTRLRYANILYEETENIMQAEEALSKGIAICDRHRYFPLKYDMQHLLARILFQKNPRAAFKFLNNIQKDVEAYQHTAWVYAFKFLNVSLHLELATHQDLMSALSQLRSISHISKNYGDKTILAVATTLEALTCLRMSSDVDSIEQSQRALATVRSLQLDSTIGELHQLAAFIAFVDMCCCFQHCDPSQTMTKMRAMQTALKTVEESNSWKSDGAFPIPISGSRMPPCKSRSGIVRKEEDGSLVLMFNWMPKDDIYNFGYLLSGIAMMHRNGTNGQKSEHMLEEGIRRLEVTQQEAIKCPKSITTAAHQSLWHEQVICYMRLHLAFNLSARTSWSAAKEQQAHIRNAIEAMDGGSTPVPDPLLLLSAYLEGVISQGTGDLTAALAIYGSKLLSIHEYRKTIHPSQFQLDIALLSALNTLLIIRDASHPNHADVSSLFSLLEALCLRNPNRQIQAAYNLLLATTSSANTILLTKQSLQSALQLSKETENNQLMCMVLNFMAWKFFRGVVGDQAQKSAQASQATAHKCMNALWMSVSAGVLGDTLEAAGKIEEARRARESGLATAKSLPELLQVAIRNRNLNQEGNEPREELSHDHEMT